MTWQEGVAIGLVVVGLLAGGYIAAQRPSFWIEFGARLLKAGLPYLIRYVSAPEPDDVRKARQLCERQGRRWNPAKQKCE